MIEYDTHVSNRFVKENVFLDMEVEQKDLPDFEDVRELLPHLKWENHQIAIDCYWKVWEIAFQNLRLLEEHGINRYPYGKEGVLELSCAHRSSATEEPVIDAKSNVPVELVVQWPGGSKTMRLGKG